MKNHPRHEAARSGAPVRPLASGTSPVPLSQAASSEMKVAKPALHPAPGCSPKHAGEVKGTAKQ